MLSCMYKYNILKRFIAENLILLNMQKIAYCATKAILITQSLYNNSVLK